ncbi:HCV capsid domain containing protein [Herbaspirillum sp. AP02]|uniref:HCV capsid domain containing protein n=1 Tax=unclassified Herbaspirillum TaxID=2624150 RepID=UPI0018CB70EB|nr:HCV capsid domain containing protein [Herbaspirillum sp. AP02]MBG7618113.1 HCV capsid domain containing protein [Herbaspirillum sp. AP02]
MSLSVQQLAAVQEVLQDAAHANALAALRSALPRLVCSRCDQEDMRGETPYWRGHRYALYLVDTDAHCWRVVDGPDEASGVVIVRLS